MLGPSIRRVCSLPGLYITAITLVWYTVSTTLSLSNKWIFGTYRGGFAFPIYLTLLNFAMKSVVATLFVFVSRGFYSAVNLMPLRLWLRTALPVALATAGDVTCSNISLNLVTVKTLFSSFSNPDP